jgi:nucleotide-binding universal stress UspA family protein
MYRKIMVPVDLQMQPMVANALKVATDLAGLYGADITLVSVSPSVSDTGTPTPDQAGADLKEMAAAHAHKSGLTVTAHHMTTPDLPAELDTMLLKAVEAVAADIVVVASHEPGRTDYISASHAGRLATYAKVSVLVVR